MKRCPKCKVPYSEETFYSLKSTYCRDCQKERRKREYANLTPEQMEKRRQKRNTLEYKATRRAQWERYKLETPKEKLAEGRHKAILKHRYQLSLEMWLIKFNSQGGRCAVCFRACAPLVVDHNHKCCPDRNSCGKCVRGLICQRCNIAVGFFEIHSDLVTDYLDKWSSHGHPDSKTRNT